MSTDLSKDSESIIKNKPLINDEEEISRNRETVLQRKQIRVLYLIQFVTRLSEIAAISITLYISNVFVNKYNANNGLDISTFHFYFAIGAICTNIAWGLISDRIGRKTVLNICLLGSALVCCLFGISNSYNSLVFINFVLGALSPCRNTIKIMIGESTNKHSRPAAFRYLPIISKIASILGGSLSTPVVFEHLDKSATLAKTSSNDGFSYSFKPGMPTKTSSNNGFSYLIACLIIPGFNIAAYFLSRYCLKETLIVDRVSLDGNNIEGSSIDQSKASKRFDQITIFGLKLSKNSLLLVIGSSLLYLVFEGFSSVIKKWPTAEVSKGGLKLDGLHIVATSPLIPITLATILLKYPYIYRKLGALNLYKATFPLTISLFILASLLTIIAKIGSKFTVLFLYAIFISTRSGIDTLKNLNFNLLLVESAETIGNLGTLYGISSTLVAIIRLSTLSKFNWPSIFSIENNLPFPLNSSLTWYLTILSLIGYWLSSKIKNLS